MKKIVLSVAVVLASLSIYATTTLQSEMVKSEVAIQAEYTEISADSVPAVVKTALEKNDLDGYQIAIVSKQLNNIQSTLDRIKIKQADLKEKMNLCYRNEISYLIKIYKHKFNTYKYKNFFLFD